MRLLVLLVRRQLDVDGLVGLYERGEHNDSLRYQWIIHARHWEVIPYRAYDSGQTMCCRYQVFICTVVPYSIMRNSQ